MRSFKLCACSASNAARSAATARSKSLSAATASAAVRATGAGGGGGGLAASDAAAGTDTGTGGGGGGVAADAPALHAGTSPFLVAAQPIEPSSAASFPSSSSSTTGSHSTSASSQIEPPRTTLMSASGFDADGNASCATPPVRSDCSRMCWSSRSILSLSAAVMSRGSPAMIRSRRSSRRSVTMADSGTSTISSPEYALTFFDVLATSGEFSSAVAAAAASLARRSSMPFFIMDSNARKFFSSAASFSALSRRISARSASSAFS
mmetsp:Transcript_35532/g.82264  ORF Transcript_35532/g.82264 Transcript_35532/m.82264 type:complete len:264 (-) Transcript_35532:945-1736(-)